jgi:hypothetical protein
MGIISSSRVRPVGPVAAQWECVTIPAGVAERDAVGMRYNPGGRG